MWFLREAMYLLIWSALKFKQLNANSSHQRHNCIIKANQTRVRLRLKNLLLETYHNDQINLLQKFHLLKHLPSMLCLLLKDGKNRDGPSTN